MGLDRLAVQLQGVLAVGQRLVVLLQLDVAQRPVGVVHRHRRDAVLEGRRRVRTQQPELHTDPTADRDRDGDPLERTAQRVRQTEGQADRGSGRQRESRQRESRQTEGETDNWTER